MGLFKKGICHICKKEAVYHSRKKNTTRTITVCCTETAENMIKNSAVLKNDVLYREVQCDLIAKEFSYHDYCYNILTKPVYQGKECNDNNYDDSESDLVLVRILFLVTFWKIIKLFLWGHWQVYTTWSKEMIADTTTSWKWSWKIGIDFFNLLIVNSFSSSRNVNAKQIVFTQDWELKSLCTKAHWTLGWQ